MPDLSGSIQGLTYGFQTISFFKISDFSIQLGPTCFLFSSRISLQKVQSKSEKLDQNLVDVCEMTEYKSGPCV